MDNKDSDEGLYMSMDGKGKSRGSNYLQVYSTPRKKTSQEVRLDSMAVFYCDDALEIVTLIDKKFSKNGIRVQTIPIVNSPVGIERHCSLLLLTPDMESALRKQKDEEYFRERFGRFDAGVILCHDESVNAESTVDHVTQFCGDVGKWQIIHLDGTRIGFKKALLDIMAVVESPVSGPALKLYTLIPTRISSSSEKVAIVFRNDVSGHISVTASDAEGHEVPMETKRTSSCIFTFKPKGLSSGTKDISVTVNGKDAGTSQLKIRSKQEMLGTLLKDICNPIEFMGQSLQLQDRELDSLDRELSDIISAYSQKSPFQDSESLHSLCCSSPFKSQTEYPTLLHFAAKHGLALFCNCLLRFPESRLAKNIRNLENKTPADLARVNGHIELASKLVISNDDSYPQEDEVVYRNKAVPKVNTEPGSFDSIYATVSDGSSGWTDRMTQLWDDEDLDIVPSVLSTKL